MKPPLVVDRLKVSLASARGASSGVDRMQMPVVIPTDPPGPGWTERLQEAASRLQQLRQAIPDVLSFLCIFCRTLGGSTRDYRIIFWSGIGDSPIEFPDGQRVRLPPIPPTTVASDGVTFAVCESCTAVISQRPLGAAHGFGFVRCNVCDALILRPSSDLWDRWEADEFLLRKQGGRWKRITHQTANLCFTCQQKVDVDPLVPLNPGVSEPATYLRYVLRRRPEPLPVRYEPVGDVP